ncbi:molybdate ABC transporter substrate-binding protein [Blastopirellula sp. JC732]|uniref:Molybdate ABC transporter substrate-binding protein n=1 Tax=Blastopirellula sediminis TaxID=2894196 RepID=A0A9X1SHN1_9BACT|nr:molybdate ABC transporter substrate-binding protein [Blastopirellula sediminis]MCC9607878.1 molybdate ABC transporter substrate-binding protein [Blastopirellula sediminis]MCC9627329.1 molybdate ABC transporter substrate-binding protein [Blastopirellula sediminis]
MTRNIWLAIGAAVCVVLFSTLFCGPVVDQARSRRTILVLAAASLTDAVEEAADAWEEESGEKVRISFGPSNALAQQILAGAPADIYLSANEQWADALAEQDRVEKRVALLSNRLVWIVPKENRAGIADPSEIAAKAKRIALAGENVPAGIYADQSLHASGLYDEVAKRIVRGNDVRTTLAYVEQGEVDAGIVYATDAAITDRVTTLGELDPASYDPIRYPAILLKGAEPAEAKEFFAFLQSPAAQEIFARHHFVVLPAESGESSDPR